MKKSITIALNDGENRTILMAAAQVGMTASAYVRHKLGLPPRKEGRKIGKEVYSRRFAKMLREDAERAKRGDNNEDELDRG